MAIGKTSYLVTYSCDDFKVATLNIGDAILSVMPSRWMTSAAEVTEIFIIWCVGIGCTKKSLHLLEISIEWIKGKSPPAYKINWSYDNFICYEI